MHAVVGKDREQRLEISAIQTSTVQAVGFPDRVPRKEEETISLDDRWFEFELTRRAVST